MKREGLESGAYVRLGSTHRRGDRELVEGLRRFARGDAYDEQPMPELDSEAIDFRAASESFASIRNLRRADMETLRLASGGCDPPLRAAHRSPDDDTAPDA
jgi:ATP-dependent DNA helicase RecG